MRTEIEKQATIAGWIDEARSEIKELGGWPAFKSGDWLPNLIRRAFRGYYENANPQFLKKKYRRANNEQIIRKLIKIAARNAAIAGAITGAVVSADEIVALITSAPTGGLNLPAQLTAATTALVCEAIVLLRIQLYLVAQIAKISKVPLNPDDPEDLQTILAFALGGAVAEEAGRLSSKVAGSATSRFIRKKISKETLATIKKWGAKVGIKILQRSFIKYAVPVASILIGGTWNYMTTARIGGIATNHFRKNRKERVGQASRNATRRAKRTTRSARPKRRQNRVPATQVVSPSP